MQCPQCHTDNDEDRRFCAECGAPLAVQCAACGFANRPGAKFCGGCGTSLLATATRVPDDASAAGASERKPGVPEAERRQLTVMFCDLVGSTGLSRHLDPEDLRALLDRYQGTCAQIIGRYEGHIARYVGDGLLVYFGYPTAHEDDARRAVRAGLDIAAAVPKIDVAGNAGRGLSVRIGIDTGLVVAGDIGTGERREQMAIVGETPNVAARLQALAGPGRVVIGETTKRLVEGLFVCESLGPQSLKGVPEPVSAYRVEAETGVPSRFEARALRGLTPLVGREHEIGLLLGRWEQATEGDGQAILLSGEAGIGKSRILRGFRERIERTPHNRLLYFCSPYYQSSAFYPLTEQIERALRFGAEESAEAKLDKLDAMLLEFSLPVEEHGPVLASLLSLPAADRYPPFALGPEESKRKILGAVMAVIEATAARSPVLVSAEDVHWADGSTLEWLGLVLTRAATLPLLAIVTYRPEFEPPWPAPGHVTAISLNRLSRRETARLASNVVGGKRLPPEIVDEIAVRTDGVPLFVEELTKGLVESGALRERDGAFELAGRLPVSAIPASLQDSLVARLDRLGPVKEVAQLAATIGRRFSLALLQAVCDLPQGGLPQALERLVDSELVYRQETPSGAVYEFKHALVRDAAYATLLKSRRQAYHVRIAEALEGRFSRVAQSEPMLLAHHYAEGGLTDKAIGHWLRAGEVFHDTGSIDTSVAAYRKVLETDAGSGARCQAWLGIAAGMRILDRFDEAFAALENAEREAGAADLSEELSRIHHLRGNLYFPLGRDEECRGAHAKALEYARRARSPELEAQALGGLGDAEYVRGRMRTANGYFRQCVDLCRRHGLTRIEAAYIPMFAHTRMYLNELHEAVRDGLACIRLAGEIGHLRAEINGHNAMVFVLYDLGDWERAKVHMERSRELLERLGARRFLPGLLRYQARILYGEGHKGQALKLLERAMEISRETGLAFDGPRTLVFLAYATDDRKVREESLAEAERIIAEGCVGHNSLFFYRDAIDVALKLGQWEEAERYAAALEAFTQAEPLPWSDFFIARGRALAARGRGCTDAANTRELERLRDQAERVGLATALPAIQQALAR
jgi:class 3 adenylate cyclase/tetratricopeptide (TPR) repeat protein